jgi:hypothetical protein
MPNGFAPIAYAVRHIAAPEHCDGYIGLHNTREEAEAQKTFEYRYSRRYPSYVIEEVYDHKRRKMIQEEVTYGRVRINYDNF